LSTVARTAFDIRSLPTLPADALLSRAQVAAWLQATERQVERWRIPRLALSRKVVRYKVGAVRNWLEQRALAS
jgi:hypothetical protein